MYQWQFEKYKASAEEVGRIFEEIEKRDGAITPEAVVEEARPEDSPLHDDFEWNDTEAARKFRIDQARKMISLVIRVADDKPPVRGYVNVERGVNKGRYMSIQKVVEDGDLWAVVLANARRELQIFTSKNRRYKQFAKLIAAMDEFLEETA